MLISFGNQTSIRIDIQKRLRTAARNARCLAAELTAANQKPWQLGAAFGLGTLMSLNPVPLLDMMLALLLLRALPRLPRGPYLAAMATWNSLVMAPLYATMPRLGRVVVDVTPLAGQPDGATALLVYTIAGGLAVALMLVSVSAGAVTLAAHLIRHRGSGSG